MGSYRSQLLTTTGETGKVSSDVIRGYRTIREAGNQTAKLDPKTGDLITLAVAVTVRCDGCITTHTDAAIKHRATKEDVVEALGVAITP